MSSLLFVSKLKMILVTRCELLQYYEKRFMLRRSTIV